MDHILEKIKECDEALQIIEKLRILMQRKKEALWSEIENLPLGEHMPVRSKEPDKEHLDPKRFTGALIYPLIKKDGEWREYKY